LRYTLSRQLVSQTLQASMLYDPYRTLRLPDHGCDLGCRETCDNPQQNHFALLVTEHTQPIECRDRLCVADGHGLYIHPIDRDIRRFEGCRRWAPRSCSALVDEAMMRDRESPRSEAGFITFELADAASHLKERIANERLRVARPPASQIAEHLACHSVVQDRPGLLVPLLRKPENIIELK
jgi:hypothetical protein